MILNVRKLKNGSAGMVNYTAIADRLHSRLNTAGVDLLCYSDKNLVDDFCRSLTFENWKEQFAEIILFCFFQHTVLPHKHTSARQVTTGVKTKAANRFRVLTLLFHFFHSLDEIILFLLLASVHGMIHL